MSHRALGGQMDMFAEHVAANTGLHDVQMSADKHGKIVYLGREKPDEHGIMPSMVRALGDHTEGLPPAYAHPTIGGMSTRPTRDGTAEEISLITVSPERRRAGIATQMFKYGNQFADVRHSMNRSQEGSDWSKAVGGRDTQGVDTSTYDYTKERLVPSLIDKAQKRDSQLTDAEQDAKDSVPRYPLRRDTADIEQLLRPMP